MKNLFCIHQ